MQSYVSVLTILGVIILLATWLPMVLRRLPLSLPILCILIGLGLSMTPLAPFAVNPLENRELTLRFCEFVVIIALMGAGLKLDRRIGWRSWNVTWRLLGIAMPLTIIGISLIAWWLLGVPVASALLVGAALAPTDPVLASDVQVGPHGFLRPHDRRRYIGLRPDVADRTHIPHRAVCRPTNCGVAEFAGQFAAD